MADRRARGRGADPGGFRGQQAAGQLPLPFPHAAAALDGGSSSMWTVIWRSTDAIALRRSKAVELDLRGRTLAAETALEHAHRTQVPMEALVIRDGARVYRVAPNKIAYLKACDDYVEVCQQDGARLLAPGSLAATLRRLPPGFERIHRSYVVNLACVVAIERDAGGRRTLRLQGGERLPVGRKHASAVSGLLYRSKGLRNPPGRARSGHWQRSRLQTFSLATIGAPDLEAAAHGVNAKTLVEPPGKSRLGRRTPLVTTDYLSESPHASASTVAAGLAPSSHNAPRILPAHPQVSSGSPGAQAEQAHQLPRRTGQLPDDGAGNRGQPGPCKPRRRYSSHRRWR